MEEGSTVAIFGLGPVGLAVCKLNSMTSQVVDLASGFKSTTRVVNELSRKHLKLDSRKMLFTFVYLVNEPNLSLVLDSNINQVKSKHNNMFVNKLVSMSLD